ncbi:Serine/threonine-protein kinase ppk29, partial [Grifola frondosa]
MQAYQQAYPPANKGTLVPGQTIAVGKHVVQVERYLSQGGFAHVYLVRTAAPVCGTTHHVLKRIAVPNEVMLTEVKKEVDIMRLLRGHPNIVYLIDAASNPMANGTYEVFILMEFCSGGGIIDMMNRRLRERLTEPEILTIFVDVCEGLAYMHSLKPPLLHRDLKVENILQSSQTSYKLCDFGSATAVQKVPSNTQEMRMLEADLNRHTTLQYRAPEMVDVYLRRPVDEKSDVWALGVLLYKLCYYTTPFEEHGPLAILNVQYKIPPYPVYSNQMNALIGMLRAFLIIYLIIYLTVEICLSASMLREHGAQRPTVFEILAHVHRLRGTKSRFTYNIPPIEPLSPRGLQAPPLQTLSPNIVAAPTNPLDELVSFKSQRQHSASPAKNAGIEAREKVLEAIAPMRRGRPNVSSHSRPSSPQKGKAFTIDMKFSPEEDLTWKGVQEHPSGLASTVNLNDGSGDAWGLGLQSAGKQPDAKDERSYKKAFESDFSSNFGDSFEPARPPSSQPLPKPTPSPRPLSRSPRSTQTQQSRFNKDAFDGLGLSAQPPPQTLGEARKSRTGLASFGLSSGSITPHLAAPTLPSSQHPHALGSGNTTYRPPSAHPPRPSPSPQLQSLSAVPSAVQSWRQNTKGPLSSSGEGMSAEERFPSLEDLDRTFATPSPAATNGGDRGASTQSIPEKAASGSGRPSVRANHAGTSSANLSAGVGTGRFDGVRSQHVTGTAMRESKMAASRHSMFSRPTSKPPDREDVAAHAGLMSRPSLSRKHRSSISIKSPRTDSLDILSSGASAVPPALPPRPEPSPQPAPRDWLTGADDEEVPAPRSVPEPRPQPVLRDSPSKRASYFERSPITLQKALEAENVLDSYVPPATKLEKPTELEREWNITRKEEEKERPRETLKAETRSPRSPVHTKAFITHDASTGGRRLQLPRVDTRVSTQATASSSPSGLTDNWSPVAPSAKKGSLSSSSEEGPEEVDGFAPRYSTEEIAEQRIAKLGEPKKAGERRRRPRSKGRQNSVHDLVDLWGGGVGAEPVKPTSPTKRSSMIVQSTLMRPPPVRSASPHLMTPPSGPAVSRPLPMVPSASNHHRQVSAIPVGARRLPGLSPAPSPAPPPASAPKTGRARPQSMFLSSVSKSSSAEGIVGSSTESAAAFAQQALSPPTTPASGRYSRRNSISDMVQRYEARGTSKPPPAVAAKPASLNTKVKSASSVESALTSPSAAATRFPKLSPTTSPVLPKASLVVPDDSGMARHRASPTGLPSRASPVGRVDSSFASSSRTNGLPPRRSPEPAKLSYEPEAVIAPIPERKASLPTSPGVRSPSPEKPYKGVSKLIDRWQRAVDDSVPVGLGRRGGVPIRRAGVVGGDTDRGR